MISTATSRIRTPGADEAASIYHLEVRTFRDTYAADTRPEDMDAFLADAYSLERVAAELADPRHHWLIAEVDGELAGFAQLRRDERHHAVRADRPVLLGQLYLDRAFQGRGLGSALMGRAIDEARTAGHDAIWLGVWGRNSRAIGFYRTWGFRPVGEMPFTFGREQHRDLVMSRAL